MVPPTTTIVNRSARNRPARTTCVSFPSRLDLRDGLFDTVPARIVRGWNATLNRIVLVATAVSKHYDTPRGPLPILDKVSMTVGRGESVAIMGPSGCGKSTLLYMLGALEPPTSGEVTINGTNP